MCSQISPTIFIPCQCPWFLYSNLMWMHARITKPYSYRLCCLPVIAPHITVSCVHPGAIRTEIVNKIEAVDMRFVRYSLPMLAGKLEALEEWVTSCAHGIHFLANIPCNHTCGIHFLTNIHCKCTHDIHFYTNIECKHAHDIYTSIQILNACTHLAYTSTALVNLHTGTPCTFMKFIQAITACLSIHSDDVLIVNVCF